MIRTPLVSTIIATYNRKVYVRDAIDSVLDQNYPSVELIVIDDGSTDGTGELLHEKYSERIHYIYQENLGRSEARNHGIRVAKGEYIAFLDSDDIWKREKIARQMAFMEQHQEYGLTHTFSEVMRDDKTPDPVVSAQRLDLYRQALHQGYNYEAMSRQCIMFLSTVMVRTEIARNVGPMDIHIPAFEDWDWYLRIALVTNIGTLEEILTDYRIHSDNSTQTEFLSGRQLVARKHLAIIEHLPASVQRRSKRNFYLQLAAVAYNNEDSKECGQWVRKAAVIDPFALLAPRNLRYALTAVLPVQLILGLRRMHRYVGR